MKRIAYYIPDISIYAKQSEIVSSHIQLPSILAKKFNEKEDITIITSFLSENCVYPKILKNVKIKNLSDGIIRKKKSVNSNPSNGYDLIKFFKFYFEVLIYIHKNNFEIFHSFGSNRVLIFTSLIKCLSIKKINFFHTIDTDISTISKSTLFLINKNISIVTSTNYSKKLLESKLNFKNVTLIKHGIKVPLKKLSINKKRVLYWRDPTFENGADLCVTLFKRLSKEFPNIIFTIAVRKHTENIINVNELDKYKNIEYKEYPYPDSKTIFDYLSESICVILPFRKLSTNPQLCVLESMFYKTCVITTSIESNKDFIEDGMNGFLINKNDLIEWETVLRKLLFNKELTEKISINAHKYVKEKLSWDKTFNEYKSLYRLY